MENLVAFGSLIQVRLYAACAGGVFAAAFFVGAFFRAGPAFFVVAEVPAFFAAHLALSAATMFALPFLLNRRFGFLASVAGVDDADSLRILDHLARWLSAIFLRDAALNLFRFPLGASDVAAALTLVRPPESIARSSAIWVSSLCR